MAKTTLVKRQKNKIIEYIEVHPVSIDVDSIVDFSVAAAALVGWVKNVRDYINVVHFTKECDDKMKAIEDVIDSKVIYWY